MARMSVEESREHLLAAAAVVIARDGISGATTRAITDEAGMRRGHFHYCFESKHALLQELIKRHVMGMVDAATATWRDDRPFNANIEAGVRAFVNTGRSLPNEELLSYELAIYALRSGTPESARIQYAGYVAETTRYLTFVSERACVEWSIPIPALARMLASIVDGSLLHWLVDGDDDATNAAVAGFAELLSLASRPA